jgi:hypothetical protein
MLDGRFAQMEKNMNSFFDSKPSNRIIRLLIIIGIITFLPLYLYIANRTMEIVNINLMNKMYLSFNINDFSNVIFTISSQHNDNKLAIVYFQTLISTIGFFLCSFSLSVIIIRSPNHKLKRISRIFPIITFIITVFDIATSIIMIAILQKIITINIYIIIIIDLAYIIRVLLLYSTILWFILSIILIVINRAKISKDNKNIDR